MISNVKIIRLKFMLFLMGALEVSAHKPLTEESLGKLGELKFFEDKIISEEITSKDVESIGEYYLESEDFVAAVAAFYLREIGEPADELKSMLLNVVSRGPLSHAIIYVADLDRQLIGASEKEKISFYMPSLNHSNPYVGIEVAKRILDLNLSEGLRALEILERKQTIVSPIANRWRREFAQQIRSKIPPPLPVSHNTYRDFELVTERLLEARGLSRIESLGMIQEHNKQIEIEKTVETVEEITSPEPVIEETVEVTVAEPVEEGVEQSSNWPTWLENWWLWLVGAVVVIGGILKVRHKK